MTCKFARAPHTHTSGQTRHAQLRKMLTMETCKCSLDVFVSTRVSTQSLPQFSDNHVTSLYARQPQQLLDCNQQEGNIPMSLMSKPRTGIPSRPAHGQAHLQLGLFLDRFCDVFFMSFCLTVVSVRLRGLNGSCHFPTGPRQGANQGPHFQQHLQQSWPVSKKDFVKNTSKGE